MTISSLNTAAAAPIPLGISTPGNTTAAQGFLSQYVADTNTTPHQKQFVQMCSNSGVSEASLQALLLQQVDTINVFSALHTEDVDSMGLGLGQTRLLQSLLLGTQSGVKQQVQPPTAWNHAPYGLTEPLLANTTASAGHKQSHPPFTECFECSCLICRDPQAPGSRSLRREDLLPLCA